MNGKITYRQQYTRCGKERCRKCREGSGHGPYWYAYWSEKGRTVSKYIGTALPELVEAELSRSPHTEQLSPATSPTTTLAPVIRVYLLGQFRVEHWTNGEWRPVDSRTWHRRRARALLGCLLSSPGRRLGREQIMELLWPDLDIDIAANRLNGAVHELRQILEPDIARPAASRMLRLERDILELADSSQIWVDAEEFENLLKKAEASTRSEQTAHYLDEATELYKGHYLLEELYSEWAAPRRDALQRAWVGLQLKLADLRAQQGTFVSAIETLDRLRTADPTNETALQRLMILLTQLDRRGEALQIYRQHESMLQRDYEGEPLPETSELYHALRKGHIPTLYALKTSPQALKEKEKHQDEHQESAHTSEHPHQGPTLLRPAPQLGRHNQSPLIGRERELETMQQLLIASESARAPLPAPEEGNGHMYRTHQGMTSSRPHHTHFLLLRGEAGIGKTRLAEELSLEAYRRGWNVAWSRSYEQERAIPYRPWTEMLRTLLHSTSTDPQAIATRLGITEPSTLKLDRLSVLVPELAQALPPNTHTPSALPYEQERLHLWEATLGLLGTFSKVHPLLLVFDDLHWADDSSIELLTYLTHHLQDQRILLVGTCRDGELAPQHKLRTLTVDLQREQAIAVVSVQPLTRSQIGTLLAYLPQEAVHTIQTQASGNPFFAEELARYISSSVNDDASEFTFSLQPTERRKRGARNLSPSPQSDLTTPNSLLPEGIAAVLERRLNRLSNGCQTLLGRAVVLGGSFELEQLKPMATEYSEDTILDLLEEALNAGLLTEEGTGAHITYHFWHPLIISHLYSRLSAARRAQLHRRAAEAIKMANAGQPEKVAAAIFHHLSKGGVEPATIAYYAELAGNQAFLLEAYSEAQQYYLHAIQALLYESVTGKQDTHQQILLIAEKNLAQLPIADPLRVCRLLEHVAEGSSILGNFGEARCLYESALTLRSSEQFQQYREKEHSLGEMQQREAQIQGLYWREIGITWASTGEYSQAYTCYTRGKEVMARAGVETGAAWACLHLQYGATLRIEGRYHEAHRYLQEALTILEQVVGDQKQPRHMTQSLGGRELASPSTAESPQPASFRTIPTRTELAMMGDPLEVGYAHERLGIVAASLGQPHDGLEHLHTALQIYEQSELVSVMARVCGNLGAVYITRGEHGAARNYMHRALNLAERAGNIPTMAFVMHNLGDVEHRSGALREAAEWFMQSLTSSERMHDREHMSWCNAALATVQEDLGDFAAAARHLREAISIGRAIKSTRCICYALVGLADLRIAQALMAQVDSQRVGDQASLRSQRLLQRARATLIRAIAIAGMEVENIIDGKHHLATVHFLQGDLETAREMTQQILKESQEHETARITGRAYRLLGRILAAQHDLPQATSAFQQALQICRERDLKLEYARALHSYGSALLQRANPLTFAPSSPTSALSLDNSIPQEQFLKGMKFLEEARMLFEECHAMLDLTLVSHLLKQISSH